MEVDFRLEFSKACFHALAFRLSANNRSAYVKELITIASLSNSVLNPLFFLWVLDFRPIVLKTDLAGARQGVWWYGIHDSGGYLDGGSGVCFSRSHSVRRAMAY